MVPESDTPQTLPAHGAHPYEQRDRRPQVSPPVKFGSPRRANPFSRVNARPQEHRYARIDQRRPRTDFSGGNQDFEQYATILAGFGSHVITDSGPNKAPRFNAYTDPTLTTRNAESELLPNPGNLPLPSGSTTLGNTRPVYATDEQTEINTPTVAELAADAEAPVPPKSPNSWAITSQVVNGVTIPRSRDPYRVGGMVGQPFYNNSTGNPPV